jgi:hypothetical protein
LAIALEAVDFDFDDTHSSWKWVIN